MSELPSTPLISETLLPSRLNPTVLEFLNQRRSTPLLLISEHGPDEKTMDMILRLASRVPDHRKVVPWRFILFEGKARQEAGKKIEQCFAQNNPQASQKEVKAQSAKFTHAGAVVGLVFSPDKTHKTPLWEQHLTVGAVGLNLLLAANAAGFAGVWLTDWLASDPCLCRFFGLKDHEKIAGFFHVGRANESLKERPRPKMSKIVTRWQPKGVKNKEYL